MLVFIIGPRFTMGKIETRLYGRASVARLEVGLHEISWEVASILATEYITLIAVLILSLVGHNMTVVYAVSIVLFLKAFGLTEALNILGSQGLNWGIVILTAAILVPVATGTITIHNMMESFKTQPGIVAVIAGVLAAIAGGSGVTLLSDMPDIIPALIIGTMAGVLLFHGVAVGPLIAGGFTYFVLCILKVFSS